MNRGRTGGASAAPSAARVPPRRLALLLAWGLAFAIPASAGADPWPLRITGTQVLPPEVAADAAGAVPSDPARLSAWGAKAARRIVAAYKARGYTYARAWFATTPFEGPRVDVDEGRMSGMVFQGASPQQAVLFRIDVAMPDGVLHRPTLEKGLKEIRAKYKLVSVDWRVQDREELIPNGLGEPVALRELRVTVVRRDGHDWAVEADLDSTFGLVPSGRYRGKSLLVDDDRIGLRLAIGVPYRRYLFDAKPQWTWVHGAVAMNYRTAPFLDGRLAVTYEASGSVSRYDREDLRIRSFLAGRWSTYADLQVHVVPRLLSMSFGFGVGNTYIFALEPFPPVIPDPGPPPAERSRFRYLIRTQADLDTDPDGPLAGRKRNLHAGVELGLTRAGHPMLDLSLRGRYEFSFGYHDLLLKARGFYLLGEVLFWDDRTLASEWQRVFFGNRYWVRQAAQLEVAGRLGVWKDKVKVGLFHDLSVFADRTRAGHPVSLANGFGPSVHFLIFDQFRLDLYYGFGFAPKGFDHNFSMVFQSTF